MLKQKERFIYKGSSIQTFTIGSHVCCRCSCDARFHILGNILESGMELVGKKTLAILTQKKEFFVTRYFWLCSISGGSVDCAMINFKASNNRVFCKQWYPAIYVDTLANVLKNRSRSSSTEIEALKLARAKAHIAVPGKVIQIEDFLLYLWSKKEALWGSIDS